MNVLYKLIPVANHEFLLINYNQEYDFVQKNHNLFKFKQLMTDSPLQIILI